MESASAIAVVVRVRLCSNYTLYTVCTDVRTHTVE